MMGDFADPKADQPLATGRSEVIVAKLPEEIAAEEALRETWRHAEAAVAATFRVLTACVKHGSVETKAGFLDRMAMANYQNDVLLLAGHAGVFTSAQTSECALHFVQLWNAVLSELATADRLSDNSECLPLLDQLARLLPRLLVPWSERIGSTLDIWKRTCQRDGLHDANNELLNQQATMAGGYVRMFDSLRHLAGLYSRMLTALSALTFSKEEQVHTHTHTHTHRAPARRRPLHARTRPLPTASPTFTPRRRRSHRVAAVHTLAPVHTRGRWTSPPRSSRCAGCSRQGR